MTQRPASPPAYKDRTWRFGSRDGAEACLASCHLLLVTPTKLPILRHKAPLSNAARVFHAGLLGGFRRILPQLVHPLLPLFCAFVQTTGVFCLPATKRIIAHCGQDMPQTCRIIAQTWIKPKNANCPVSHGPET